MKNFCFTIMFFCFIAGSYSQQKTISGTITTEDGSPLPGASVIVKNTANGAQTDFDGKYSLEVNVGDVLEAFYLGFRTSKITIDEKDTYDFILIEDAAQLDEIVITGYTKEKKSDIAGAITVVKVDELAQEASPNILTTLQGRVAGIQINSGGTPGGNDTQISIRGISSLTGGSPLWVIDGVQTFNPSSLNPEEIESIQVLKDGASAAIYGTSAANGVIVVTTKKGKDGESQFSFSSETSVNFLRQDIKTLNARQWADVYYQARANDGITGDFNVLTDNGSGFTIPEFLDPAQLLRASDTDWVDAITKQSISTITDFNYRYGNEKLSVFSSVGYAKDNGTQIHTFYERFNARVNASYKLWNDRITIGENFLYSNFTEVRAPGDIRVGEFENAILQNPLIPVFTEIGTYSAPTIQDKANSVANLWSNRENEQRNQRFLGNVYVDVNLIEGLTFSTKLNFEYNEFRFETRTQPFLQLESFPSVFQNITTDDILNSDFTTIWSNLVQYQKEFGKHRIDVFAGAEFFRQDFKARNYQTIGVDITQFPEYITRPDAEFRSLVFDPLIEYRKQSFFGKLKYVFDDKYILSGSLRRDGSSKFGPNNKTAIFKGASFAWNIKKESFLKDVDLLSNLKFRASWGQNGSDRALDHYEFNPSFIDQSNGNVIEFANYDLDGDGQGVQLGIIESRQANPDLKWEVVEITNFGIDIGLLNNRLNLALDVFDKRTKDLIVRPISQAINGEALPPRINAGEMSNKGYEVVLSYQNKRSSAFNFNVDLNLANYENNIESLDTENNFLLGAGGLSITRAGDPIASFFGLVADGIFRTPEEVAVHADQLGKGLGRIRYRDLNNDGVIDQSDRTIIGNPHPDFIYGINLSATYKGFDMSAFFDGKHGHDLYNNQRQLGDFSYFAFNFHPNALDAWSPSNANSNVPALSTINSNNELQASSYFVEDGSYFRLKTITLGYTFPNKLTEKWGMDKFRIYLTGQYLFNLTSFTGYDYEVPGLDALGIGIAGYQIPHNKTISFGISTKF